MRISDWSSDVCSSDLCRKVGGFGCQLFMHFSPFQINSRVIRDDHEGHYCSCSMPSEMLPLGGEHSRAVRLSTAPPSFQHLDCSQPSRRFSIAELESIGTPATAATPQQNNLYH